MQIGLFFGTFNPVHIGHMIIANYMAYFTDLDEVWFIVSPQNPFKDKSKLLSEYDRLHLVDIAINKESKLRSSDIEFSLPKPSYTVNTLTYLKDRYPDKKFTLIMGADNLYSLHKWQNYEYILKNHKIYLYNRPNYDKEKQQISNLSAVTSFDVPLLNISSTFIRHAIKDGKNVAYFLPNGVFEYIDKMLFYR